MRSLGGGGRRPKCCGIRVNLIALLSACVVFMLIFYVWCITQFQWGEERPHSLFRQEKRINAKLDQTAPGSQTATLLPHLESLQPVKERLPTTTLISKPSLMTTSLDPTQAPITTRHEPTRAPTTTTLKSTRTPTTTTVLTTPAPKTTTIEPTRAKTTFKVESTRAATNISSSKPESTAPFLPPKAPETPPTSSALVSPNGSNFTHPGHVELSSFEAWQAYLEASKSDVSSGPLFLLFLCDKDSATGRHWSTLCDQAEASVYTTFSSVVGSKSSYRLVTIRVGSEASFNDTHPFKADFDLRLHAVPCLMRYSRNSQGYGETEFVLEGVNAADTGLLEYAFHQGNNLVHKSVETVTDFASLKRMMRLFEDSQPTYLLFISGAWPQNQRMWCVYCRFREAVVEYAFHKYAAPDAKLIKVRVAALPVEWNQNNPFKKFDVPFIPYLQIVHLDLFEHVFYQPYRGHLDDVETLKAVFERDAYYAAQDEETVPGIP
ncbi:hypothetical protein AC1031_002674 [Aphanomyces cochlioides]|nr:hypothetical protein AC1031_002674 [Aphanomyces cochlioides]